MPSYAEAPDVVVVSDDEPRVNGYANGVDDSEGSDAEMPPLPPIKVSLPLFNFSLLNVNAIKDTEFSPPVFQHL